LRSSSRITVMPLPSVSTDAFFRSIAAAACTTWRSRAAKAAPRNIAGFKSYPRGQSPGILSARAGDGRQGSSCKSPPVPAWTTRDGAAYTRTPARTKESRMKRLGRIAALAATSVLAQAAVANDTPHQALARDILAELVAINTAPSGGPDLRPAVQAMAARLRNAGFAEDDITVVESTDRIVNLVARYRSSRPARRPLLMMAHIDVVEALP